MRFYLIVCSFFISVPLMAQLPVPSLGKIIRHDSFPSQFVTARNVDVWLPEGYSPKKKYAVLYMHDGQMLYDSSINWNKQEWGVDETITRLMKEKKIKDVIVVGVWNGGKYRHTDYFPQKPFESLSKYEQDTLYDAKRPNGQIAFQGEKVHSDLYLKFLVTELKPFIDKTYSTKTDRVNTFIAGSSMGGLISMYAICEYPDVFGGAACLSTHWPGIFTVQNNSIPAAFMNYLRNHLPSPDTHKIYFDYGDATLDALYPPLQKMADEVMKEKGFTSKNWMTKYFPGEEHSENAWRNRLDIPLLFLLKK
ncbi:MAG: alpha/beta hydrolase [Lacibacter sp.]|jgi:predicted alpha/beta superfamily hydrolase